MELKHQPLTGLVFKTVIVHEYTVMNLEPLPAIGCK
jgi:hypothetical protein